MIATIFVFIIESLKIIFLVFIATSVCMFWVEQEEVKKKVKITSGDVITKVFIIFSILGVLILLYTKPNKEETLKDYLYVVSNHDGVFFPDCKEYILGEINANLNAEDICQKLNDFSKQESKNIIKDIVYPSNEDMPTKECDARGCVYSD